MIWSSMPACKHRSRSPIIACAVNAMIGTRGRFLVASYRRMCSVASIPPMNGIDTSIWRGAMSVTRPKETLNNTHKDDVVRLVALASRDEAIDRKLAVLGNLYYVTVLLENLHG